MARFRVSGDLRVAFVIEVEAASDIEAEDVVAAMGAAAIRNTGSVEGDSTTGVEIDGSEEI